MICKAHKGGINVLERYEQGIWDDLEDEEVDKVYEELYYLR